MILEYLPIKELTKKYPFSDFQIRRFKKSGLLRYQSVIMQTRCSDGHIRVCPVTVIWEGDLQDIIANKELTWISVGKAAMICCVTGSAVRYWLNNGFVRHKKKTQYLVCKEDCLFYQQARLPICPRKQKQS